MNEDPETQSVRGAVTPLAACYLLILAATVAGYVEFGWWVALLLGLLLHLSVSDDDYLRYWLHFARMAKSSALVFAWLLSIGSALLTCAAAYAVGFVVAALLAR